MKLNQADLNQKSLWDSKGIHIPQFNRQQVIENTTKNPKWIHFGPGNIFKAFPAAVQQQLIEQGIEDTGIIIAEGYDYEIIDRMSLPHDNLSLLVTLKVDGTIEQTVIGSVTEALKVDSTNEKDFSRLKEIFASPSLQMVSFTITEKGYSLVDGSGQLLTAVAQDFVDGPTSPQSYIGKLVALCYHRYQNGTLPIALVSMDNCSHNGDKLKAAVQEFAEQWSKNGLVETGFVDYLKDTNRVSFPWSMIDKITPRPDETVEKRLDQEGFEEFEPVITSRNTYVAPFVNAEETQYLVIEDQFPNGRPSLEKGGVLFTDRETVDKVEKMKVCTCLNPLHTALAIFGCLLDYKKISDEMNDNNLVDFIKNIGYVEGLPVVVDPKILSPKEFIDNVIQVRLPNPFMPDTPQRIATDTSQKLSIRFGETIKAYEKSPTLQVSSLKSIPLVLAGWCRYLMGIDDNGNEFELSADPAGNQWVSHFSQVRLGEAVDVHKLLKPLLENKTIFGVDLYHVGLGECVEQYFAQLIEKPGAVRSTLNTHLSK